MKKNYNHTTYGVRARKKYAEKCKNKTITFNKEIEGDLLEFAERVNFGQWVKSKIKEEINKQGRTK